MKNEKHTEVCFLFLCILTIDFCAARPRLWRALFQLYHEAGNLSREKSKKNNLFIFPETLDKLVEMQYTVITVKEMRNTLMIIRNFADCPFGRPTSIDNKKVRFVVKNWAICF